ncbi:hypothetical protein OS493_037164 [Desmophyllum pertusum]|uniref:Major facilitator superfamily (MFS) profile domain-containing protein n=1 Tax=Desmophyllum pertusum TaxID=174260 RepID=A0A9W9Z6S1_9CNID|nr:hypothetical protein OS493_037164 [Desmophyllum pertusum]
MGVVKADLANVYSLTRTRARLPGHGSLVTLCRHAGFLGYWKSISIFAVLLFLNGTAQVQLQSIFTPDIKLIFMISICDCGCHWYFSLSLSSVSIRTWNFRIYHRMIPELCWASCCVKLVRYCMYMWLPMYLNQALNYTPYQAGYLSTVFEIGGVLGTAMLGFCVNRFLQGRIIYGVTLALFGSTVFMALFQYTGHMGLMVNAMFMLLAGACNCGVDPYLSGSITAEIGERENAQAATSGLVNGFGGLGPIIEGPIVGWIADKYGWAGPFYMMVGMSLLGSLTMLKASRIDQSIRKAQFMGTLTSA